MKVKNDKEPSLFRKLIDIYFEQAKRRKAVRLLERQSWSFDFLAAVVNKAAKLSGKAMSISVTNKDGTTLTIVGRSDSGTQYEDSIFDHLDDDVALQHFIAKNSTRGLRQ